MEQVFNVPKGMVWKAITDKEQMPQWFFEAIADFKPEVGFETQFNVHLEGVDYLHLWKVTEVIPEVKIVYGWRYEGYPGDSFVMWELSETSGGTKLRLEHHGVESFPQDDPIFSREAGRQGWEYFLQQSLKAFLEKKN
ncbi:MAG: SRPBCC domain-containing protein, partial [Gammaproteobacteria bacterium]|nr:SRPBCC domain-containing protein [Gammaproteobacteria bacterium]